jgi:hypothetical protein
MTAPLPLDYQEALAVARELKQAGVTYQGISVVLRRYHGFNASKWTWKRLMTEIRQPETRCYWPKEAREYARELRGRGLSLGRIAIMVGARYGGPHLPAQPARQTIHGWTYARTATPGQRSPLSASAIHGAAPAKGGRDTRALPPNPVGS